MRVVDGRHWATLCACILAVGVTIASISDTSLIANGEVETQHVVETAAVATEKDDLSACGEEPEEIIAETTEAVKEADFEVTEAETEPVAPEPLPERVIETTAAPTEAETEAYHPVYMVDSEVMDLDLQRFAYEELESQGIGWWMPYFCLTAYQESRFNVYDVTDDLDYGLLQYRITFWEERAARYGYPGADVFNAYVQIYIYVRQTAARLASGCSVFETISRHYTSDHGSYCQEYVDQVMSHSIEQIH